MTTIPILPDTPPATGALPRLGATHLSAAARSMPIVVVMGGRQTGKSTLVRSHPAFANYPYLTLDDVDTRALAMIDPVSLLGRAPRLVIDEVQRAPDMLLALKALVDEQSIQRQRQPGQFILTGSANLLAMRKVRDSLAGRAVYTTLWPMTRREQLGFGEAGSWSDYFETPVTSWYDLARASTAPADDWRLLARTGGYPVPAIELQEPDVRALWFTGYIETWLERDLRDLASLSSSVEMHRLMRLLCARLGQLSNRSAWAGEIGMSATTALRYLDLLEQSWQLVRLEAFTMSRSRRVIKNTKVYWGDTGLALHLAGESQPTGAHFENIILNDLLVWREAQLRRPAIMHWRTVNHEEVDFVVEQANGTLLPIECKTTTRPTYDDVKGLRLFLSEYPEALGGLLLYDGTDVMWMSERVLAVPWWSVI